MRILHRIIIVAALLAAALNAQNEIKAKLGTSAAGTITLASLVSSTTGVGRQSTLLDNLSADLFQTVHIFARVRTGTSPTADRSIFLYFIKCDDLAETYCTDGAGASDAAFTAVNAIQIAGAATDATSDQDYYLEAVVHNPGAQWGIAIVHDTGVNLNSTASNHFFRWHGENPEVQ